MKRKIENLEKEVDLTSDLQGAPRAHSPRRYRARSADASPFAGDLDNMAVELEAAEVKIEELRSQLDVAAEAQDMLEELTERNLRLQDVSSRWVLERNKWIVLTRMRSGRQDNEVLKADVEELEALKELADELEESHAATEKQLQDELGMLRSISGLRVQDGLLTLPHRTQTCGTFSCRTSGGGRP